MPSLRTYLPNLASYVDRKPDALFEWQKALVAEKVLTPRPGLGPGSGVDVNGKSIATFLLAILASEIRADAIRGAKQMVKYLPATKSGKCPFTGATTLRDAIATALERNLERGGTPAFLVDISHTRAWQNAVVLTWSQAGKKTETNYWPEDLGSVFDVRKPNMLTRVSFSRSAIDHFAADVRNHIEVAKAKRK